MPWPFLQVEVIKKAYMQGEVEFEDGENGEDGAASPRNVGHNIYILAHQVRPFPSPPARQSVPAFHACALKLAFPVRIQPEVVWARGNVAHGYRQPPDPECEVQAASSVPFPQGHVLGNPRIS